MKWQLIVFSSLPDDIALRQVAEELIPALRQSAGMLGEALALARRGHVATADVLDVIAASALGSPMVIGKVGFLKASDYTPTFSGLQMAKDLDLILNAANATGVAAPLAAFMRTQHAAIRARGEIDRISLLSYGQHQVHRQLCVTRLLAFAEPELLLGVPSLNTIIDLSC